MLVLQNPPKNATTGFPTAKEVKNAFAEAHSSISRNAEAGFIISHANLVEISKNVFDQVAFSGSEIPIGVAGLLAKELSLYLNPENTIFTPFHKDNRLKLTNAAKETLDLILTAGSEQSRMGSARLGLIAIEALSRK